MQGFAEFVAENYESNVDLFWDHPRPRLATARFGVEGVAVTVSFEQLETDAAWRVAFVLDKGDRTQAAMSAFAIFNGVMQALEEFLDVRQPEVVVLVSKTDQHFRIYETYLRRERDRLQGLGYRLEPPSRLEPYVEFTLRRTIPSAWRG